MGKIQKAIQKNTIKIFFVRHGETNYNAGKIKQGQLDIPLNQNGITQAEQTAERLFQEIKGEDRGKICIVSSDLQRAKTTAKKIKDKLNLPKLETSKIFREAHFGIAQGKPKKELKTQYYSHPKYWNFKHKGENSETREEVANRFNKGFKKYIDKNLDKKIIIFVSHSNCIKNFLEKYVIGEEVPKLKNCEYKYLEVCNLKTN